MVKVQGTLNRLVDFGDALSKGPRHHFRRLPFLRAQDVLNIRLRSLLFAVDRLQRIF